MERILITGGSGFIGSNVVAYFKALQTFDILNIDIHPPPHEDQRLFWKQADILDARALNEAVVHFQPKYVVHLAARTDLRGQSLEDYNVNYDGTRHLIDACNSADSVSRIIFASSMLVCKVGYIPSSADDYNANTPYGVSKVKMEQLIRAGDWSWDWSIVRPTSIWGPGFKEPYRDFFEIVARKRFIDLGKKYCSKTYGYIGNTTYQIYSILIDSRTNKKMYYLGDDPPIFISDWGKEIAKEYGFKAPMKMPFLLIRLAALTGDLLKIAGLRFPMTSFRLKNMTTDNIMDLKEMYNIAPNPPYTRLEGIKKTVAWLKNKDANR